MTQLLIAGVDEVGRGPLAGPVVAAAVILDMDNPIHGLMDSKKLTEKKRTKLSDEIKQKALCYAICEASVEEIDEINILQASLLAMKRAVEALEKTPTAALIDGNKLPDLSIPAEAIVKGDQTVESISAASIIAKVYRDTMMIDWAKTYPEYGFESHKGYPTKIHLAAIEQHGILPIHRRSFAPVRKLLRTSDLAMT